MNSAKLCTVMHKTERGTNIRDLEPANDCSYGHAFTIISFTAEMWQTGMMQEPGVHTVSRKYSLSSTMSVKCNQFV